MLVLWKIITLQFTKIYKDFSKNNGTIYMYVLWRTKTILQCLRETSKKNPNNTSSGTLLVAIGAISAFSERMLTLNCTHPEPLS